jgi:hypothetical protein
MEVLHSHSGLPDAGPPNLARGAGSQISRASWGSISSGRKVEANIGGWLESKVAVIVWACKMLYPLQKHAHCINIIIIQSTRFAG